MCDPITLALGAAATGGGALLNRQGNRRVERAQQAAIEAENARQRAFEQQAAQRFDELLPQFTAETQQAGIDEAETKRTERILENVTESPLENFTANISPDAPKVVQNTVAAELLRGLEDGKSRARGLGRLGAFGEQQFGNIGTLGSSAFDLGTINEAARRSGAILPGEVAAAERKRGSGILADLFNVAGQTALTAGATGQGFDDKLKGLFKKAPVDTGGGISRGFRFGGF